MDVTDADLDLTPRDAPQPRRRSVGVVVVIVALLGAFGFLLYQGLDQATLYFYNADEAVAKKADLGDHRFRLQGTVLADSVEELPEGVSFTVTFNGAEVPVDYVGDPPELFQEGIPAVVEGRWEGDRFAGDRIIVKHTETYVEKGKYDERIREAETGGTTEEVVP
jgi:cytochrome c-type biogenesis protein CcmE